jgi:hypothetical protein
MIVWPNEVKECKYRLWYEQLILKAKQRVFPIGEYGENHHIIPRSLGGTDFKENVVRLYAREHYIAHLLLWKMKMSPKMHNKMSMALHVMVNGSGNPKQNRSYLIPARIYELSRIAYVKAIKEHIAIHGPNFKGSKHTLESIQKIKDANARTKDIRSAKLTGTGNGMYGKTHTDKNKKLISERVSSAFTANKKEEYSKRLTERWKDPIYKQMMKDIKTTSERWLNRDWKASGRKAADAKMANGWKHSDEAKKKLSETRKAKFATGEIVAWNKGTGKEKHVYTEEEKLQRKLDGIAKSKATKAVKVANGWVNPRKGTAKVRINKRDELGWVSCHKGVPKPKEQIERAIITRKANYEAKKLAGTLKARPKHSEEAKQKIKEKRNAGIAEGKIITWNKGKKEDLAKTEARMKKYYKTREKNKRQKD